MLSTSRPCSPVGSSGHPLLNLTSFETSHFACARHDSFRMNIMLWFLWNSLRTHLTTEFAFFGSLIGDHYGGYSPGTPMVSHHPKAPVEWAAIAVFRSDCNSFYDDFMLEIPSWSSQDHLTSLVKMNIVHGISTASAWHFSRQPSLTERFSAEKYLA